MGREFQEVGVVVVVAGFCSTEQSGGGGGVVEEEKELWRLRVLWVLFAEAVVVG